MGENIVITIARQYGSGGKTIGCNACKGAWNQLL